MHMKRARRSRHHRPSAAPVAKARRGAARDPRIGVIVPANIELGRSVLQGVRAYCNDHPGTRLSLLSNSGYMPGLRVPRDTVDCLVLQESDPAVAEALAAQCRHIVVTSNRQALPGVARVLNDDRAIGWMGADYFLGRGFRTLAFVRAVSEGSSGGGPFHFAIERESGFVQQAEAAGATVHCFTGYPQERSPGLLRALLDLPGPVGVMTSSDLHARWLIEAMGIPRKIVPRRLAILGVDDDSLENALSPIGISTVCPAGMRIGYEAAALGLRLARCHPVPDSPILVAPRQVVTRESTSIFALADPVVLRALRLIRERTNDLLDAAALVKTLKIPRRTLEVRFRKSLGSSPANELLRARIQRAGELLATTELSIKEIAYLVGFSEPRMLSRCFKKMTGEKPTEYRERVHPGSTRHGTGSSAGV